MSRFGVGDLPVFWDIEDLESLSYGARLPGNSDKLAAAETKRFGPRLHHGLFRFF